VFDRSIPGSDDKFNTYFVLAGRTPRASTAWASGRSRERRGAASSSGRLVAHSQPSATDRGVPIVAVS
jgi:hypothetical protein